MAHPITDEMLIDHLAVLAKTGRGKTYLAKGVVERLLKRGDRVCIVDPKNAWWGLKSSADGKQPGFAITIFGGPNGDMPLLASHGKVLGEAVANGDMSCIICTKGMTEGDRIRFLTDFFQTLDRVNSEPLHLVLDEAHMMAPQRPLGEMQRLTHWTAELVSGGRGMGFRIMLLSQRPARLNKDVLTQCETLVAMGMTGPQDRNQVRAWIEDQADVEKGKEIVASLTGLPKGTGWLWSPQLDVLKQVKFPLITTYDNSATKRDKGADSKAKLAPVDLKALEALLGQAAEEIKANDPGELRKQIAALKRELASKPDVKTADPDAIARALLQGQEAGFNAAKLKFTQFGRKLLDIWKTYERILLANAEFVDAFHKRDLSTIMREVAGDVPKDIASLIAELDLPAPASSPPIQARSLPVFDHKPKVPGGGAPLTRSAAVADVVSKPQQGILDGLAWWVAAGKSQVTRPQLAGVVGKSPSSGGFNNLIGSLVTAGLVVIPSPGSVALTTAGGELANLQAINGLGDLHGRVRAALSTPEWEILAEAMKAYPEPLTREELASRLTPPKSSSSGGFNNLIGALCTLDLLQKPKPGSVVASDWLYPF